MLATTWQGLEPARQIWPRIAFPPGIPLTFQFTVVLEVPLICTASVTRWFAASVAVVGETLKLTPG